MAQHDIVIRGGTVVDGTGAPARTADIAIRDGLIVEVGHVAGDADKFADGGIPVALHARPRHGAHGRSCRRQG